MSSSSGPRKRQRTGQQGAPPSEPAPHPVASSSAAPPAPAATPRSGPTIGGLVEDVLVSIFYIACLRDWNRVPPICAHALLDPDDAGAETEFSRVQTLRAVCKRWRSVVDNAPCLWERLALKRPNDAACSALAALPPRVIPSVRGIALWECVASREGLQKLRRAFRHTLAELTVLWDEREVTARVKSCLAYFSEFERLEVLHLQSTRKAAVEFCDPWVRGALQPLSLLHGLRTLILSLLCIQVPQLEALEAIAGSLRHVSFSVILEEHDSEAEVVPKVVAACARLTQLERLRIGFVVEGDSSEQDTPSPGGREREPLVVDQYPNATEAALQPLGALKGLESLVLYFTCQSLAFLRGLCVQHLTLTADLPASEAAFAPIATLAPTLRSLTLTLADDTSADVFAPPLLALARLEALELNVGPPGLARLAEEPLAGWSALRQLTIDAADADGRSFPIPARFLDRLRELPALRSLHARSPLPIPESMAAAAALRGLHTLRLGPDAQEPLQANDGAGQRFLEGLLPDVRIVFDEKRE